MPERKKTLKIQQGSDRIQRFGGSPKTDRRPVSSNLGILKRESARPLEQLQPLLRKLEVRIRWWHLLQQRARLVDTPLTEPCEREQKLHRRLIGLKSHADLQSIGGGIESVAEQLHQP